MHIQRSIPVSARTVAGAAVFALVAVALAACNIDKALKVESPSRIPAADLENPANATLIVNGALSDFDCAFGSYVVVSGLIGEELDDYTQTAARWPYDRRDVQSNQTLYSTSSCEGLGAYTPLQTARVSANNARRLLEGWTDAQMPTGVSRPLLIATASAFEAWSMLFLSEGFCSTVFSTVQGTEFNYQPEITRTEALTQTEARFTAAIQQATALGTAGTNLLNMALVGRARTRLDLGNVAGARADAVQVPANFVYNITASAVSGRRNNRVYNESNTIGVSSSVSARFRALNDPRVPWQNLNRPNALGVPAIAQLKYTSAAANIPLATGDEAQLIVAEADVASNPTNAINIINAQRAKGQQGIYAGLVDAASLKNEIIDQRRRALFLTGTNLGDLIRYNLLSTIQPPRGAAYPAGGTYGDQLCMPLPDVEKQNNPVIAGA